MLHIFTSLYISAKYDSVIYVYIHTPTFLCISTCRTIKWACSHFEVILHTQLRIVWQQWNTQHHG